MLHIGVTTKDEDNKLFNNIGDILQVSGCVLINLHQCLTCFPHHDSIIQHHLPNFSIVTDD